MNNPTDRTRRLLLLLHFGLLFFLFQPVIPAGADPVAAALVVASDGSVTAGAGGGVRRLEPMAILDRGETVSTGPDGTLTLLFFPDGREYTLGPKSSARMGEKAVERLAGIVTASRGGKAIGGLPPNPRINSKRVAGEVLRGDRPYRGFLVPPPNGATLEPRPEFRWTGRGAGEPVRLTLVDAAGKELASREVRGDRVSTAELGVPNLEPDRTYTALLRPAGSAGPEDPSASFSARFRVLPRHEAEQVLQARREAEAARQSGRKTDPAVLEYFFLLAELKLYTEAIQVGESLRRELPGNIFVLRLLALAYRESGQRDTSNRILEEIIAIETKPRPPAVSE